MMDIGGYAQGMEMECVLAYFLSRCPGKAFIRTLN